MVEDHKTELVDYLDLLWRRKWLVVLGTLACVLGAGVATWLWPKTYTVQTTIDTGDLREEQAKDVERLVARLNATGLFDGEARPIALTAEYKKPLVIELRAETRSPAEAANVLERVAAKTVEELSRLLKLAREKDETRLDAIRLQMEAVNTEAESVLATLQADVENWIREARRKLRAVRGDLERGSESRARLEREIEALQQSLQEARSARAEGVRGMDGVARALVVTSLIREITDKESRLTGLEQELNVQLPARIREQEAQAQQLTEQLSALEAVKAALAARRAAGGYDLAAVRRAAYRAALTAQLDLKAISTAAKRVEVELAEQLRTLKSEAGTLSLRTGDARLARVIARPLVPRVPTRPRPGLNLSVAFVAGLMGSVLLVFGVEYVRAAGPGHRPTGGTGPAPRAGDRTPAEPPR